MGIGILLGIVAIVAIIANVDLEDEDVFYNQKWYNDAVKKFGDDYYYPPSRCHAELQSNGTYIQYIQHYKPVRSSEHCTDTIYEDWFVDIFRASDGHSRFIQRYFGSLRRA